MPHYVRTTHMDHPIPSNHKLEFTTNSVRNTTFATKDDMLYYEIVTRFWHPKLTKINILDPDTQIIRTVAEVERTGAHKRVPKHRVRFLNPAASDPKGRTMSEWIADEDFIEFHPDKVGGIITDREGNQYRWRTHNGRLQMCKADDAEKRPLVKYHRHRRYFGVFRMYRHASLEMQPEIANFLDRVIASYIIVERRRRIKLTV